MSEIEVKAGQVWVRRIRPDENIGQRRILRVREDGYVYWERPGSTLKSSCSRQQWLHYARGAMLQNDPLPALLAAARELRTQWTAMNVITTPLDRAIVAVINALTAYEQQRQ